MTGAELVSLARTKLKQQYVLGADVPLDDPAYAGPWDCAELVSWLAFQATRRLLGCVDNSAPVGRAEPFSGGWASDIRHGVVDSIPIDEAIRTAGAVLVRAPKGARLGHVALSTGDGGTIEAHSARLGVIEGTARGRAWTHAGLIRGVTYESPDELLGPHVEPAVLRVGARGPDVLALQEALGRRSRVFSEQGLGQLVGLDPGAADAVYGPRTRAAVFAWQVAIGHTATGEVTVGGETARALGLV